MYSTDTGVYYAHGRDAGGDLRPLRRHEQFVSLKKVCFAMVMIPLLRVLSVATNESVCLFDMWVDLLDIYDATSSFR